LNELDKEEITRVGPGTLMGNFMRQYWIPALKSTELIADAPPTRLKLFNEKLIAFRDSSGRPGIFNHECPHRCASLFLGRNEKDGLRCIYHGWKFDVNGQCLDMPNVSPNPKIQSKIKAKAYKVLERSGVIWVYLGESKTPPLFPEIEATLLPESELVVDFMLRKCNWLQALDGEIDTSHIGFLHWGCLDAQDIPEGHPLEHIKDAIPQYHVCETEWGTHYSAYRFINGEKEIYWRSANFLFPFWTQTPQGEFASNVNARAWVPLDDENTMFIYFRWTKRPNYQIPLKNGLAPGGNKPMPEYIDNSTDWLGRWRLKADASNDWLIDRYAQSRGLIFSGIDNIHLQDQAVTESMGPIANQLNEHLVSADLMIAKTRKVILKAARDFRDHGKTPPGLEHPEVFMGARSGYFITPPTITWGQAYMDQVQRAIRPKLDNK
jgi:hypothetical protein